MTIRNPTINLQIQKSQREQNLNVTYSQRIEISMMESLMLELKILKVMPEFLVGHQKNSGATFPET